MKKSKKGPVQYRPLGFNIILLNYLRCPIVSLPGNSFSQKNVIRVRGADLCFAQNRSMRKYIIFIFEAQEKSVELRKKRAKALRTIFLFSRKQYAWATEERFRVAAEKIVLRERLVKAQGGGRSSYAAQTSGPAASRSSLALLEPLLVSKGVNQRFLCFYYTAKGGYRLDEGDRH